MKKIFVTVAEFLENGGKILKGRELFAEGLFSKKIQPIGKYLFKDSDGYVTFEKPNSDKSEDGLEYLYVQIDCTPIYK